MIVSFGHFLLDPFFDIVPRLRAEYGPADRVKTASSEHGLRSTVYGYGLRLRSTLYALRIVPIMQYAGTGNIGDTNVSIPCNAMAKHGQLKQCNY